MSMKRFYLPLVAEWMAAERDPGAGIPRYTVSGDR